MSNEDETIKILWKNHRREVAFRKVPEKEALRAMREHTNQTLQELKAKVRNKSVHFPSTNSKYLTENDIITLIDEAINE